ncbi:MAG: hypothetical protein ABI239_10385 [Aquihabitans sp.]
MANRDTSKQRRAKENRAKRAALAARTSGEPPKRPSRVAPSTAEKLANTPRTTDSGDSSKGSDARGSKGGSGKGGGGRGDKGAKPKRERPKRLGDTPVDIDSLEGSWFSKVIKVPGGTQVLMAVVLTIMVTGMLATMDAFIAPEDADKKDAKATLTIFEAYSSTQAMVSLAVPLLLVFAAAAFALHKQRRRIWVLCAVLLAVLFGTTLPHYIFPVGFLAYAVMRSSKVEGPNESLLAGWRRRRASNDPASDVEERSATVTSDATDTTEWIE